MSKSEVAIIGAGIQGVCNALFLQKKGINVTLFDKDEPRMLQHLMEMQVIFHPYASIAIK